MAALADVIQYGGHDFKLLGLRLHGYYFIRRYAHRQTLVRVAEKLMHL